MWAPPDLPSEVPPPDPSGGGSPFLSLLVTLVVFLIVVAAAWLAARWLSRRMYGPGAAGEGRVRVLERLPLEPRRTLYLVEAGDKLLLLGASEHELRLLAEFRKDELPAPPPGEKRTFLDALKAARGR